MVIEIIVSDDFGNVLTSYSIEPNNVNFNNITDFIVKTEKKQDIILDDVPDNKPLLKIVDQPLYYNQAQNKLTLYFSMDQLRDFIGALATYLEIVSGEVAMNALTLTELFSLLEREER